MQLSSVDRGQRIQFGRAMKLSWRSFGSSQSASAGSGRRRKAESGELQGGAHLLHGEPIIAGKDFVQGMTVHEISEDGGERNASFAKGFSAQVRVLLFGR